LVDWHIFGRLFFPLLYCTATASQLIVVDFFQAAISLLLLSHCAAMLLLPPPLQKAIWVIVTFFVALSLCCCTMPHQTAHGLLPFLNSPQLLHFVAIAVYLATTIANCHSMLLLTGWVATALTAAAELPHFYPVIINSLHAPMKFCSCGSHSLIVAHHCYYHHHHLTMMLSSHCFIDNSCSCWQGRYTKIWSQPIHFVLLWCCCKTLLCFLHCAATIPTGWLLLVPVSTNHRALLQICCHCSSSFASFTAYGCHWLIVCVMSHLPLPSSSSSLLVDGLNSTQCVYVNHTFCWPISRITST